MTRLGWLDCASGVSGDMLLSALVGAGADVMPTLDRLRPVLGVERIEFVPVTRGGLQALHLVVEVRTDQPLRTPGDLVAVIDSLALAPTVRDRCVAVVRRLAAAESAAHGIPVEQVHFHEIGAADTLIDVVGVCGGLAAAGLDRLVVSPVALGGGTVSTSHGTVPVPTPAAVNLLAGTCLTGYGGGDGELATPTGLALLAEWATGTGPMPALRVDSVGVGAGSRDEQARPNVVRLVVGVADDEPDGWLLLAANVDDLDPRLWPGVLDALLTAGAADAWLTPILMKKGRPAHVVSALVPAPSAAAVRSTMFRQTSTLGVRTTPVAKHALDRRWMTVDVDGQAVRVKLGTLDGTVVSVNPEWDDVAAAARALGRPAKAVLAAAAAVAHTAL